MAEVLCKAFRCVRNCLSRQIRHDGLLIQLAIVSTTEKQIKRKRKVRGIYPVARPVII